MVDHIKSEMSVFTSNLRTFFSCLSQIICILLIDVEQFLELDEFKDSLYCSFYTFKLH